MFFDYKLMVIKDSSLPEQAKQLLLNSIYKDRDYCTSQAHLAHFL